MATTSYNSPRWSQEIADCSVPLTFDQYSTCSYGCLYCFSIPIRQDGINRKTYRNKGVISVDVPKVIRLFSDPSGKFGEYIRQGKVLQWGGLSDPFCRYEKKYRVGLDLLKFFRRIDYPLTFSTKGVWFLEDPEYINLFRGATCWNMKFSLVTGNEDLSRSIEIGVPSPVSRIRAIERYSMLGAGGATLRLRPFIPGISDGSFEQLIRDASNAGATAVSTEFLCIEERSMVARRNYETISKFSGLDLFRLYRKNSITSGYLRLNRKAKRDVFYRMKQLCDELGVRFYVSDSHFKELSHGGSCCGLPDSWNYSRGQYTEALVICKRDGNVCWSDISGNMNHLVGAGPLCLNLDTAEKRSKFYRVGIMDYLRYMWNHPDEYHSPYRYFEGIMVPSGTDEHGDIVYRYNPGRE